MLAYRGPMFLCATGCVRDEASRNGIEEMELRLEVSFWKEVNGKKLVSMMLRKTGLHFRIEVTIYKCAIYLFV